MELTITLIIIIITCLVSVSAFSSEKIMNDMIFYPPAVTHQRQWYRFFTCGLIHADFIHLAFNMFALYGFGRNVERMFALYFHEKANILFLIMYILALFFCLLPTYLKHKNDSYYRSLGASGAVSAVIFASILLRPASGIGMLFIPTVSIPGFIFGPLYLFLSSYLDRRGGGNINHSAHLYGAVFGLVFVIIAGFAFTEYNVLELFVRQVKDYLGIE